MCIIRVDFDEGVLEVEFEGKEVFFNLVGKIQGGFLLVMFDDIMGFVLVVLFNVGEFVLIFNLNV